MVPAGHVLRDMFRVFCTMLDAVKMAQIAYDGLQTAKYRETVRTMIFLPRRLGSFVRGCALQDNFCIVFGLTALSTLSAIDHIATVHVRNESQGLKANWGQTCFWIVLPLFCLFFGSGLKPSPAKGCPV